MFTMFCKNNHNHINHIKNVFHFNKYKFIGYSLKFVFQVLIDRLEANLTTTHANVKKKGKKKELIIQKKNPVTGKRVLFCSC